MLYILYKPNSWWSYILEGIDQCKKVRIVPYSEKKSFFLRGLRKLLRMAGLSPRGLYLDRGAMRAVQGAAEGDSIVLLNMHSADTYLPAIIAGSLPGKVSRKMWFSNPCLQTYGDDPATKRAIESLKGYGYGIYTFDSGNAARYGLEYFGQVFRRPTYKGEDSDPLWDLYFLGVPKGRREKIRALETELSQQGFSTHFIIIDDPAQYIDYQENICNVLHSRCIVDIVQEKQSGLSLRPLEALYTNRKLLTDNPNVRGEPWYDPARVFILKEDAMEKLGSFLTGPLAPPPEDQLNNYDINRWVEIMS